MTRFASTVDVWADIAGLVTVVHRWELRRVVGAVWANVHGLSLPEPDI